MGSSVNPSADRNWQKTLFILFVAQTITAVGFSSIFPFLPLYVGELGSSSGLSVEVLAGLVFSAQGFTMMIASPLWGAIADRYGRKLMVERAMFGGAVILFLMAFVRSAEQLVILRTIQGFITGTVAAANALVASIVPRQRAGFAMGLLQAGLGGGVALGPLIGGAVADSMGYHATFYITSALLFLSGILVWWGVEDYFVRDQESRSQPYLIMASWRRILVTPGVIAAYSMRFISALGRMMIVPIAPLFIQTLLIDTSKLNTFTGLVIGIASGATTLSAIYLGRLGDRIGYRRIVVISALIGALLYLLQSFVTAGWQLLVLQAMVGVALGGIIPAISALLARITTSSEAGAVYGLDNSIQAGSRAVAPLLGSAVAVAFNLRATFAATALLYLVTALIAMQFLPRETEPI